MKKKNNLRIEHFDGDFGGGVDGPQVGQQSVSTEDGAAGASLARVIRRLDENLVGRTGSFAQCPSHVGQISERHSYKLTWLLFVARYTMANRSQTV